MPCPGHTSALVFVLALSAMCVSTRAHADELPTSGQPTVLAPIAIRGGTPPMEIRAEPLPVGPRPAMLPFATPDPPVNVASSEAPTPVAVADPAIRHWSVRPHLGALFGNTIDRLSATVSGVTGSSELTYSHDTLTAGVDGAYLGGGNGRWPWSIAASFTTNMTDPFGTLLDRDWFGRREPLTEFSHTDSRLSGRIVIAEVSMRLALAGWRRRPAGLVLDAVIGYRHEAILLDAWGATGWYLDAASRVASFLDPRIRGLHYESQRALPHVGLGIHGHVSRRMLLDGQASIGPVVAIDDDDHVLRFKRANATSTGVAVMLGVAPRWIVAGVDSGPVAVVLGFDAQLRYFVASGTLHQHFYADDPATPRDERTFAIPDSAYTTTSLVASLRTTIDLLF